MTLKALEPGHHYSLGANWDGEGVNFALFSAHAEKVELCLYDSAGQYEISRHTLPEKTHDIWHGYYPGLQPGAIYGYRVYGPHDPQEGHRFNPNKLLIDPYAKQLHGEFSWNEAHFGYHRGDPEQDISFNNWDNAPWVPKSVVVAPFDARPALARPRVPWRDTTLYELHTRGFTIAHPDVPELMRGRFAGLSQAKIIEYLKALGITSVELLPVHAFIDEHFLVEKGLGNYWGYNTLNFFSPHGRYLSNGDIGEFRQMVDAYHDAGLEVILDVVYNHTCESNHFGPTLSFRGIDNASYYRLQSEQPRYYLNDTGCGNTLNTNHPRVMRMVMDSLRYWSGEMGVDGFRFDLAAVMGREAQGFNREAAFFQAVNQDPQLTRCKFIAEPWDIGPGGYQLGNFPAGWSEWNDNYRDTVRRFWRREPGNLPSFARCIHGSSDIFERSGRKPWASINYVASHDGFTLRDLVSYQERHNSANGEGNRDGHRDNLSDNFGIEGETDNPTINRARRCQQRNMLATLMVSQGVSMLQAGDELGRTQQGNNNAYCQDNDVSWLNWNLDDDAAQLREFASRLIALRRAYPLLKCPYYLHSPAGIGQVKIAWLNSDGEHMRDEHWQEHHYYLLGYMLTDSDGTTVLTIFNNERQSQTFHLPEQPHWYCLADTSQDQIAAPHELSLQEGAIEVAGQSVTILTNYLKEF
ncbi:glycogen debranching protein GlgX [Porticoccus sp. GXU_MW_L64]